MGFDHAEQKEIGHLPASASSSNGSISNSPKKDFEKQNDLQEQMSSSALTENREGDGAEEEEEIPRSRRTQPHTLGKLKLRGAEDDLPTDWWFASTAIPLIAATFAPMANLLSIAALVVYWRNHVNTEDALTRESLSDPYKDPAWCYNLNVASLICGFVGNLFLLLNFTRRVRYIVALPATIFLFYIASGILIGITLSMNIYDPPGPDDVYSQGFWHAVIAACLYMFNSMILMVNMAGYFLGHYPQHFTLTDEQRNLILQTMMFFIWLGGGAAVFSYIEPWSFSDALYFCDVTILTIGFGDFFATEDLGRGLVFPYSVGGTIILGLMVSSIHKFAGELSADNVLRKHVETRRVNTLSRVVTTDDNDERRRDLEEQLRRPSMMRPSISDPFPDPQIQRDLDAQAEMARQVEFQEPDPKIFKQSNNDEPSSNQFLSPKSRKNTLRNTFRMVTTPVSTLRKIRAKSNKAILMREEKDRFDAMRNIQTSARQFKKWYALLISVIAFGILWCVGAAVIWQCEKTTQNMTYFQGLYFCYVSLLTIGYGDMSPKSNAGKPFFIVWSLIAVPTMTILISDMGDTVISSFKRGTFRLADFTVLPKAGMWHDFIFAHPWLFNFMTKRAQKKRIRKGFPVGMVEGPTPSGGAPPTIDQLARESLTEAQLTKKLAFAIRQTADDLCHHPGKRYSYEDWVRFTRLIRFTKMDISELEEDEDEEGLVEWDWLDENSPMVSHQSESEWVLDRLCESLLRLLKKNNLGTDPEPTEAPTPSREIAEEAIEDIDPMSRTSTDIDEQQPVMQDRRRSASGADAVLTFFTGERRGTHAYAYDTPKWSKMALDRQKNQRRKSSTGSEPRGPFSKLHLHRSSGGDGGSRDNAGPKTLKARYVLGNDQR